jgi:hypothetical protein
MYRLPPNEKKMLVNPDDEPDLYRISELFPLPSHAIITDSVTISRANEVGDRATFPPDTRMKVNPQALQHHVEERQSLTGSSPENLLELSFLQQQEHNLVLQQQQQLQQLQQLQELQQLLQKTGAASVEPPQRPDALLLMGESNSSSSHEPFDNNKNVGALPMMMMQQQQYQMEQMNQLEVLRQQEQQLVLNLPAGMVPHDDPHQQQRQTQQQQISFLNQTMSEPSVMIAPPWNFDGNFQPAAQRLQLLHEDPRGFLPPQDRATPQLMNNMLDAAEFLAQLQANNETQEFQ